jgi:hypoxanthine phosphoribosyltransferase
MSQLVTLNDKSFKPFISERRIAEAVTDLAKTINKELASEFPLFLAILNGSFMFASDLLKQITIPCEISFVKLSSYSGTQSSGNVTELLGLNEKLEDRTVVIVEDIVDSGMTLEKLMTVLKEKKAGKIKVATVLFKPEAYKKEIVPDYIGFRIGNDFVVGYGLDYQGLGRNLREIHVLA